MKRAIAILILVPSYFIFLYDTITRLDAGTLPKESAIAAFFLLGTIAVGLAVLLKRYKSNHLPKARYRAMV